MNRHDWFRRTTWTNRDRDEFNEKLNRCKRDNKAQYLRIQSVHLAESGNYHSAIELLDRISNEFPEQTQLAQTFVQKAECYAKLDKMDLTVQNYRLALQVEREFPNVKTNAWVDYPCFIVDRRLTDLYDEALSVLASNSDESSMAFPITRYRYFVARSLIADAQGDRLASRECAIKALAEETAEHSGFRYHPELGLVGTEAKKYHKSLITLAKS